MSRRFVLDASVAAAWYLPEEFSGEARRWQRRALDGEIDLLSFPPSTTGRSETSSGPT